MTSPSSQTKPALTALGYIIVSFVFAVAWHIALFHDLYRHWKYFGERPDFPLGFITVAVQGIVLGYTYAWLRVSIWKFVAAVGLYHWTVHVPAFMAKEQTAQTFGFLTLETLFLVIQFTLFGIVPRLVWQN